MLTNAQLNYLNSKKLPLAVIQSKDGKRVAGGDEQFLSVLNAADVVDEYREYLKEDAGVFVDQHIAENEPRAFNKRYQAKTQEAVAFNNSSQALPDPDEFPYLKEEASERGITMKRAANQIIKSAKKSSNRAAKVERRRLRYNTQLDSATTLDELETLHQQLLQDIRGL